MIVCHKQQFEGDCELTTNKTIGPAYQGDFLFPVEDEDPKLSFGGDPAIIQGASKTHAAMQGARGSRPVREKRLSAHQLRQVGRAVREHDRSEQVIGGGDRHKSSSRVG